MLQVNRNEQTGEMRYIFALPKLPEDIKTLSREWKIACNLHLNYKISQAEQMYQAIYDCVTDIIAQLESSTRKVDPAFYTIKEGIENNFHVVKRYQALSQRVFGRIWDNPEDAIYDEL